MPDWCLCGKLSWKDLAMWCGGSAVREYGRNAQPGMHMVADYETEINSVIVIEIYEYIFQEVELIGGFLARI